MARAAVPVLHIEYFGWASSGHYGNPGGLERPYRDLLAWCRARRLWLFVSVANDNKGSGKYGDDRRGLDDYLGNIDRAVRSIRDQGREGVLVQPVGETQTDAGRKVEAMCRQQLVGWRLVYNGGSRPRVAPAGYWRAAYHPASVSAPVPKGVINVSDHSGILVQLQVGGLNGKADLRALGAYAAAQRKAGIPFVYYGFGHGTPDEPAIRELGKLMA
jgi:hypothetical protein